MRRAVDDRISRAWGRHPHRVVIEAEGDFLTKAANAIEVIKREVPACCRSHLFPTCKGHKTPTLVAGPPLTVNLAG